MLDRIGATEKTTVVAFADHGEYLGDFELLEKWPSGLDPCLLQNPLILASGGMPGALTFEQPVEMVDLLPTLCGIAGAAVADQPPGPRRDRPGAAHADPQPRPPQV